MKVFIILILAVFILGGCSLVSHSVKDVDRHIQDIVKAENSMSVECQAGFFSGISIASDTSLKMKTAIQALDALVPDKSNPEYLKCKSKGISIAVLAIASKEKINDIIDKVIGLGLF